MSNTIRQTIWLCISLCALALLALSPLRAVAAQASFVSPEAGVVALVQTIKADDQTTLRDILGPGASKLVRSGDPVADESNRGAFIRAYGEASQIVPEGDRRTHLSICKDGWPMPIRLVKSNDGNWRFDARSGGAEILARRIGRNELSAIQVCLAIVDAQREYAARDSDGDGLREYAARFTSKAG